jgi:hypothetical protein
MTRRSVRSIGAVFAVVFVTVAFALPAGAAKLPKPKVKIGDVEVSNGKPVRGGEVDVSSEGWRPGGAVTIAIASHDLLRTTADAHGKVKARIMVPDDTALGFDLLTVTGTATSGVPQQIVTNITVVVDRPAPAPKRPWGLVFALAAVAAVLLLASRRVERRVSAPAATS